MIPTRLYPLLLPLLLAACAALPSKHQAHYRSGLTVQEATRIAAQAMLDSGFIPMHQNENLGFVHGERDEKDALGGFHGSFHLIVKLSYNPDASLTLQVESRAGREVAISNDPPRYLAQFQSHFDQRMHEALSRAAPATDVQPVLPATEPPRYPGEQDLRRLPINWGLGIYDGERGVAVGYVSQYQPAHYAGVWLDDRLLSVNGRKVRTAAQAAAQFKQHTAWEPLQLRLERRGWQGDFWLIPLSSRPVNYIAPTPEQQALEEEGFRLGRQQQYSTAVEQFRRSLAIQPRHEAYYGLGLYLYRLGQYGEAEQALARGMALSNAYDVNLLLSLGSTQAMQGKAEGARALWQAVARNESGKQVGQQAAANLEKIAYGLFLLSAGPPDEGRWDGKKAHIALAPTEREVDGQRKLTGDGLRQLLREGLQHSGHFVVDELSDDLRRSRADVVLHTLITEFDGEAKKAHISSITPGSLVGLGQKYKEAHITVELRFTDRKSGAELARLSVPGVSITTQTGLVLETGFGRVRLPGELEDYQETPMERAIMHWLRKAVTYAQNAVPERYYR